MRPTFFVLFFVLFLFSAVADSGLTYSAAVQRAKAEGKAVYLLITAPGCRWCRKFEHETLCDPAVQARLRELAVSVEAERGSGTYPARLAAPAVPMHFFLRPDGEILVKMPGYWNPEDFLSILGDVRRKMHRQGSGSEHRSNNEQEKK